MRIMVDIPDAPYAQLKSIAARRGCSVRKLILHGIEGQLGRDQTQSRRRTKLPIIESKKPGRLKLTNRVLNRILSP
jgi:hypothetical protein